VGSSWNWLAIAAIAGAGVVFIASRSSFSPVHWLIVGVVAVLAFFNFGASGGGGGPPIRPA
jgi:hypothetical protein